MITVVADWLPRRRIHPTHGSARCPDRRSRVAADLDQVAEDSCRRPLDEAGPFTFVVADALRMKVREVLGLRVVASESGSAWNEFCADLIARGLTGVRLVTSDAHQGLEATAAKLTGAAWQRLGEDPAWSAAREDAPTTPRTWWA